MVKFIPVSVDVVVFKLTQTGLDVLLVKRDNKESPFYNQWALPGGTIDESDSDLESAAHRTLKRRTNTDVPYLEQVCTEGNSTRDPRGWSNTTVYFALVGPDFGNDLTQSEDTLAWVSVKSPTIEKLAFDHSYLFKKALSRMRNKMNYSFLPAYFLPKQFGLCELQSVYERVLDTSFNRSAFREYLEKLDGLIKTNEKRSFGGAPAFLYELKENADTIYFPRNLTGFSNK